MNFNNFRSPRRMILMAITTLIIAVCAVIGVRWIIFIKGHVSTDEARVKGNLVSVSSRVSGEIVELPVDDGYSVERGDLIARIDDRNYRAAVDQARASLAFYQNELQKAQADLAYHEKQNLATLAQAEADLEVAKAKLRHAEEELALEKKRRLEETEQARASLDAVNANIAEYESRLKLAEEELRRLERLSREGVVAEQDLDIARKESEVERAKYLSFLEKGKESSAGFRLAKTLEDTVRLREEAVKKAMGDLKRAEADLVMAEANTELVNLKRKHIKTVEAKIQEAEAELTNAETTLEWTRIQAPISGVISRRIADPGETIQAGEPIVIMNDVTDVWVSANIDETNIRKVRLNQGVDVKVDAYPGRIFEGRVVNVGSAAASEFSLLPTDNANRNFTKVTQRIPVKIAVKDPNHELKPGMMVVVHINVK